MKKLTYDFIHQGAIIDESENGNLFIYSNKKWDSSKTVIVDTGNKLKQGIIDHHQPGSENASVTSIIANDAHKYLNHLRGQDEVTIVTHFEPDLDAIASCYLVNKFLNRGVLSDLDRLIATYVNEVDSGKLTMDPRYPLTVASIINAINNEFKEVDLAQKNNHILDEGLRFISEVYRLLESDQNLWGDHFLDNMKGFDTYRSKIHKDVEEYYKDFEERSETDTLYLLNKETNAYEQIDFILTKNPKSVLWKYWVRGDTINSFKGDGFIFTCALYDEKEGRKRAIIATDPTTPFNLIGLGILLDSIEINELIRGGSTNEKLVGEPRVGFCRNNPWYDGSGSHNYTIVDAPRGNSVLTGDEIISAIRANELWHKIGEDIHSGRFDRLNFDAVKALPKPLSFEFIDENSIHVFEKADLEEKQFLIAELKSVTEKLLHLAPATEFDKLNRDSIRNRLFQSLVQYYNSIPKKLKLKASVEITNLLIETFPPHYLRDWVLQSNDLSSEPLHKSLERALPFVAPEDRIMFMLHVIDKHNLAMLTHDLSMHIESKHPNVIQSIQYFYSTFQVPFCHLEEYDETPLFLVHRGYEHYEDIIIYYLSSNQLSKDNFPLQISSHNDHLTIEEIDNLLQSAKRMLDTHVIQRFFGENYKYLRDNRNKLLNVGLVDGIDLVKRYSVSRIIELRYSDLKELINLMFSGNNLDKVEVSTYKEQLLLLLSIRRFEFLLDRHQVFLRLSTLLRQLDSSNTTQGLLYYNPDLIALLKLFHQMYHVSTTFMWHDDERQTASEINRITEELIRLKSRNLPISSIHDLLDSLYTFYSHMLEELDIDITRTNAKIQSCLNQYEYLRNDSHLFTTASSFPLYIKHILCEILLSYRRLYREKVNYLQNELQYVLEADSTSADDNNRYVDFCNDILLQTVEHDWRIHRQKVLQEDDLELKKIFFDKYFYWQSITFGSYRDKNADQKSLITDLNSSIRFAAGSGSMNIQKIVNTLPESDRHRNLNDSHLSILSHKKDFATKTSFVPLSSYYDTYDYLTERYIETFDIENVSKSISSFSSKFPAYIRWLSSTKFLMSSVLSILCLLFLTGVFDPNVYEFDGMSYRPPMPEMILSLGGDRLFNLISGSITFFWTTLLGTAFLIPVFFVLYKVLANSYNGIHTSEASTLSFKKNIERIEGKQSRLLFLSFIIPLVLILLQVSEPDIFSLISEFQGFRLISTILIFILLIVYSIYLDIEERNPKKPSSWITSRTKHMFWLHSLQALVLTVFVIDFLIRFRISADFFKSPDELISIGISKYIVLGNSWFDIVLMPSYTIIISLLTLFFTFFVNRIFRK